jgi:hypothetical protein
VLGNEKMLRHLDVKMIYRQYKQVVFSLWLLLCCSLCGVAAQAQSPLRLQYDPGRVPWTELSFHAKNFWVEVSTDVQFISLPAVEVQTLLLPSPEGAPIMPATSQVAQMTINTTIDPKFRSPVNIHNLIWFNPMDASALGRIMLRRGEDDFKKSYRFTDRGVFRHQLEPKDKNEAALDPEKWTAIKDSFYPYDLTRLECSCVTEPSVLIYILHAAAISKMNDPLSVCVFGKRQLHRVSLQREGTYPVSVSFIEKRKQGETRKTERVSAEKIAVKAEPLQSDLKEVENFSFLGLHQDISIYIDPTTRLPIQVSGIIPSLGKAELKLNEIKWAPKSD